MKNHTTYYLNLVKEVSIFTMMAYAFCNEALMETFGPWFAIMATIFMLIPRATINEILGQKVHRKRRRQSSVILNNIKFTCLMILVLYIFLNNWMMEVMGGFTLILTAAFMIIPRKLIRIWMEENCIPD